MLLNFSYKNKISFNAETKEISVDISDKTMSVRRSHWKKPESSITKGALAKYRGSVSSASQGAVTIPNPWNE